MKTAIKLFLALALPGALCASCSEKPYGAVPEPWQLKWQDMEMNMFVHFGPNTFTGREWGDGKETEDMFNPTDLDCRQWAETARAAGFKGIIITAKHHDGFCLWPNPVSSHTVARSSWRDGKGDVLAELSAACREYGLGFGIYISPWDRNDPHYGTPGYNDVFVKTLESALGSYGPVFEQWFDGANGEGPNGKKQTYDWPLFNGTVKRLQPEAVIFSDVGPGCRWCGNEYGSCGRTNWSTLDTEGYEPGRNAPSLETLNSGERGASLWIPAETNTSIRPGWFWRESENSEVKSVQKLLQIYYESVGRNSLLLLNVPPDTTGRINAVDSVRLREFRAALDAIFSDNLTEGHKTRTSGDHMHYRMDFGRPLRFNRVELREDIALGQRVAAFTVDARVEGEWKTIASETTVGRRRILLVPQTTADAIRVNVTETLAKPLLGISGLYQDDIYKESEEETLSGVFHKAEDVLGVDLGAVRSVKGIQYTPILNGKGGVIEEFRLEASRDGSEWTTVLDGRLFDNIVNNPVRCEVPLPESVQARFLRLTPLRTSVEGTFGVQSFGPLP